MAHRSFKLPLATTLSFIMLLASVQFAHAASTVWNTQTGVTLYTPLAVPYWFDYFGENLGSISYPNVSILYSANIINATTGQVIQCGSNVEKGTQLTFRFTPHVYTDISWFATGWSYDSPYGEWRVGTAPPRVSCEDKDFVGSNVGDRNGRAFTYYVYSALVVAPPGKNVRGIEGLSCDAPSANGDVDCTASAAGTFTPAFDFGATNGRFYGRLWSPPYFLFNNDTHNCYGSNYAMVTGSDTRYAQPEFVLQVPAQSISCPITVVSPIGAPSAPVVTSTSCTVGTSLELAFTSTDPNGHKLRFGVDWDDDGTADQFVPPSGYVPSSSEQSAKRTFAIPGEKHVAVMVENDRGARSEWTHYSFNCAEAPAEDNDTNDNDTNDNDNIPTAQQCAVGYEYQGGACVFTSCPIGYVKILQQCVFATCPVGYTQQDTTCIWSGCPANFTEKDGQCVTETGCTALPYCQGNDLLNGCTDEVIENCLYGCALGRCKYAPQVSAALSASPAIVIKGKSTKVSWTSKNASACAVTGTNGDSWTGLNATNKPSKALSGITTFTLHCDALQGATPSFHRKERHRKREAGLA